MVTFCVIGYYLVCYKGDLNFLTSPFCLLLRGLNVKPIRLLEEGVAPLKVKQVVLPSKMTSKRVKEMPPSIVKQLVLLLETTWTSQASQALSGVGRISKQRKQRI